jgi:biofilm protein TabA
MILDRIDNASRYFALQEGFAQAFEFLQRPGLETMAPGKHEINGDRVYAIVSKDPGRQRQDARLEAHKKYIDIQLVLSGSDEMGWKSISLCRQPAGDYSPESDVRFYADDPDAWIAVASGMFAIFFPEDAHLPMISSGLIHKIVVKVAEASRVGSAI